LDDIKPVIVGDVGKLRFKMKGMRSLIYRHQLVGTCHLRQRHKENYWVAKGGFLAEKMERSKSMTVEIIAAMVNTIPESEPGEIILVVVPTPLLDHCKSTKESSVSQHTNSG